MGAVTKILKNFDSKSMLKLEEQKALRLMFSELDISNDLTVNPYSANSLNNVVNKRTNDEIGTKHIDENRQ